MIANHMKPVLFAAALAAAFAPAASARDRSPDGAASIAGTYYGYRPGHGHHSHRGELKQLSERQLGSASRIVSGNRDKGSITRPRAYFSGSTHYYAGGYRVVFLDQTPDEADRPHIAPKAKVIDVTEAGTQGFNAVNGCTYEHGVCVIRGKN